MATIDITSLTGEKEGKLSLPKDIFDVKVDKKLIAQAIRVYLSNQRRSGAKVKTRGEVAGSGKKIYKQKGTGRARHGDRYAPIFVGGGVCHGPTGKENHALRMSQQMGQRALFGALSDKLAEKSVIVVDGLEKIEPKTKKLTVLLNKLYERKGNRPKFLIVYDGQECGLRRAAGNIANALLVPANCVNTYMVLNCDKLVISKDAIAKLDSFYQG